MIVIDEVSGRLSEQCFNSCQFKAEKVVKCVSHFSGTSNVPLMVTPHKPLGPSQINSSLVSPFNTNLLLALGQRPSPGSEEKEELFSENSLGMLSEVAQYHSELSGAEANSSLEAPVREKMANIRLVSTGERRGREREEG